MLVRGDAIGAGRYPGTLAESLNVYFRQRGVDVSSGVKNLWGHADAVREPIAEAGRQHAESLRGRLPRVV